MSTLVLLSDPIKPGGGSSSQGADTVQGLAANFTAASKPKAKIQRNPWVRPPVGTVKLNVDAAFAPDSLQGAVGVVFVDIRFWHSQELI